ncbi:MAG: hypothetical protein WC361_07960 [Bacteroidales bacterium]
MGHPEPYGLKMVAIGNEQWGSGYSQMRCAGVDVVVILILLYNQQ